MNCPTYMCEEMVIQILSRLPVKSLIRFMVVCRLWKSIITSPQFRLHSKRPTKLLVHTDRECYTLVEDDQEEKNHLVFETDFPLIKRCSNDSAVVIGSDNGLLCIGITKSGSTAGGYNSYSRVIIIWNPFIRKHVVVPDYSIDDNITYVIQYASGFGGTISSSGGDYKYVRVLRLLDGEGVLRRAVDIYSLKAGTWRRKYLDWGPTQGMGDVFHTCALLRGRLHWSGGKKNEMLSFELENEVFENKIRVPESIRYQFTSVNVTVIRESLAVITNEPGRDSTVWVMEEYGDVNSWIKLFNIDMNMEILERVERNMVHLLKNGEFLVGAKRYNNSHPKLVTFNPKTMKTCDFGGGGALSSLPGLGGFTNYYKESLVLLADD